MRERGAFGFLGVILLLTILFFVIETDQPANRMLVNNDPTVMINGQPFQPSLIDRGDAGRMIIVIDQDDLYIGENTVEIHWGGVPSSTLTAEIPLESPTEL